MEFREVRDNPPLELDAQLDALPKNARCKGMFFLDVIEQARRADPSVDLHALAGVKPQRYLAVLDYPHADWMRLVAAAGSVLTQGRRPGEGVRTLGRNAFETIFGTPLGKVLFGPAGFDLEQVLAYAPKAYSLALSFGQLRTTKVGADHVQIEFDGLPSFLETFNVGAMEGTVLRYGARPLSRIALEPWGRMTLDLSWRAKDPPR